MTRHKWPCLFIALAVSVHSSSATAPTTPAAKTIAVSGALLLKTEDGWRSVSADGSVPPNGQIVALPQAELTSANDAIRILMLADIGHHSPFPVLETSCTLHTPSGTDANVTLERGIVVFTNNKKDGAATVQLALRDQRWRLTLRSPGARVGVEIYSRHAPGLRKKFDDKAEDPVTNVLVIATKGKAFLELGDDGYALDAPPGTSLVMWDTLTQSPEFRQLDKLPPGLLDLDAKETEKFQEICGAGKRMAEGKIPDAAVRLVASPKKTERLVAVTSLGALDALPPLLDALADEKHADVRDQAVLVLRHWLGRAPGQLGRLHAALIEKGYSEPAVRTVLQLLFGFDASEKAQPATYDVLLSYLGHSKLAVRQLAQWHLARLAPAGQSIAFDPAGDEAQRRAAIQQWRRVIPEGELPRLPEQKDAK